MAQPFLGSLWLAEEVVRGAAGSVPLAGRPSFEFGGSEDGRSRGCRGLGLPSPYPNGFVAAGGLSHPLETVFLPLGDFAMSVPVVATCRPMFKILLPLP